MTRIVPATDEWLVEAARILRVGGLVAFPTETVYGLGANALDSVAVRRIFEAKGRPATNPLIVHVACMADLSSLISTTDSRLHALGKAFWPGPLTLIQPKSDDVPEIVTAGGPNVAVRIPGNETALRLLSEAGLPIAAPSANRSESVSPTRADHVAESLGDAVDLILDGGPCDVGLESTVLDLTCDPPAILRPGAITAEQIERVIGVRPAVRIINATAERSLSSPGQMRRHYAPKTRLLVSDDAAGEAAQSAGRVAIVTHRQDTDVTSSVVLRLMPSAPDSYARQLYAALRELDSLSLDLILVQSVPETDAWLAIRDRLTRAAALP